MVFFIKHIFILLQVLTSLFALGQIPSPHTVPTPGGLKELRQQRQQSIQQQNLMLLKQNGYIPPREAAQYQERRERQIKELYQILYEDSIKDALYSNGSVLASGKMNYNDPRALSQDDNFNKAFDKLKNMLQTGNYKFKDAVFISEKAYDPTLNYQQYNTAIQLMKVSCNNLARKNPQYSKEKLLTLSWAIKKYMVDTLPVMQGLKKLETVNFSYDFDDIFGNNDIQQLFITKLINTQKGNCHSLPYLYKIIAGELGIGEEAHLAYAPNHVFIRQKFDDVWWNCELTNGQFLQDWYMMATGYVHVPGIQGKIYMTPLDEKESIAACLMDLEQYYEAKYGLDNFALKCTELALEYYPNCIQAYLVRANYWSLALRYNMQKAGITEIEQARNNEMTKHCLEQLEATSKIIKEKGYVPVPKEKYVEWLETMQTEKKRRESMSNTK